MKKLTLAMVLAVGLLNVAPLHADKGEKGGKDDNDCVKSHRKEYNCKDEKSYKGGGKWFKEGKKDDPTSMPEPGSMLLLASGMVALGGLGWATKKRISQQ